MNWYKKAEETEETEETAEERKKMEDWFEKRTKRHIDLVGKYCKKVALYDEDQFGELLERAKVHDASKFKSPEKEPYIYVSWKYKCQDDGVDFESSDEMDAKMDEATEHHVKNNLHHPESHCDKEIDLINKEDRDKPPEEMIDATNMPEIDVAEMCCDWMGMSEEKGGHPKDWADKNVNVRWKFTDKQKDLIYELIEEIWE